MIPSEIDYEVACKTGEDVAEIRRRGFSIERLLPDDPDPPRPPQLVDWDRLDRVRNISLIDRPAWPAA